MKMPLYFLLYVNACSFICYDFFFYRIIFLINIKVLIIGLIKLSSDID